MDEKLIDQLYSEALSRGYKKGKNEFLSLMKSDDMAYEDMFSYAQSKGLVSDATQFGSMIGRFQAPYKKKEEPELGLPGQMFQTKPQAKPEPQLRVSPTPVGRGAQRQQAMERAAMELPSEDGLSVSAETEQPLRPSVGVVTESTAVPKVDVKAIEEQKAYEKKIFDETPKEVPYFTGTVGTILSAIDSPYSPIGNVGVGDFIDDMGRSISSGLNQGDITTPANVLLLTGKNASPDQIKKYVAAVKDYEKIGASEEMMKFSKTYEDEGKTVYGFLKGLAENPGVIGELIVSSATAMLNPSSLAAASAVTGGFAAAGAAGAAPGAAAGALSSIPWAIGAAGTALETGLTFSELLNERLKEKGLEFTEENVKGILEDEKALSDIRNKSLARGATIGVIDGLTGRLAGKVGAKLVGNTAASRVKAGLAGAGIEMVGGSVGEVAGRAVAGQEMDIAEIGLEGIAEGPMVIADVTAEVLRRPIYKVNGERRNESDIESIISTASPEDLYKIDIDIKNDVKGYRKRIQDIIVDDQMRKEIRQANPNVNDETVNTILSLEKELKTFENNKTQSGKDRAAAIRSQIKTIQQDAVQEQTAGQVPVQPTTGVSPEVAQGEPQPKPEGVAVEGIQETIAPEVTQEEVAQGGEIQPSLIRTGVQKQMVDQAVEQMSKVESEGFSESAFDATNPEPEVKPIPITVTENKELADKVGKMGLSDLVGKKVNLVMADQLKVGDVKVGKKTMKRMGGPLFPMIDGLFGKVAWASMDKGAASSIINGALNSDYTVVYNMNPSAIDSNLATAETFIAEVRALGKEKQEDLFSKITEQLTGKKFGAKTEDVQNLVAGSKNIKQLIDGIADLDVDTRAAVINSILPSEKVKAGTEIGKALQADGITIESIRAKNVEQFASDLPAGALTVVLEVQDKSGKKITQETKDEAIITPEQQDAEGLPKHQNYPIYIRGKAVAMLNETVPFWNLMKDSLNNIDVKVAQIVKQASGRPLTSKEARSAEMRAASMTANKPRKVSAPSTTMYEKFVSLISRSFPSVEVVKTQEEFDALLENLNAKKLATKNQNVYGAVFNGKLYLNPALENYNTPIHEFGHIWMNVAKNQAKDLYNKGISLVKDSPYVQQVLDSKEYARIIDKMKADGVSQEDIDAYVMEEALATAIGDKGESFVIASQQNDFKNWLNKLYSFVRKLTGISKYTPEQLENITLDEFLQAVSVDLLSGEKLFEGATVEAKAEAVQLSTSGVESLPGYDKLMDDVTNTLIPNALKRKLTGEEMIKIVKKFIAKSDIYKVADDIQRDELVRQVNGMLGEAYRNPPSAQRLLGLIQDPVRITMTEKQLFAKQIMDQARAAKNVVKVWMKTSQEMAAQLKKMAGAGRITPSQASAIIRRMSFVNMLDENSVNSFVDYVAKVFKNAEYAQQIANVRRLLRNAKRNAETKIGVANELKPLLRQVFAINPSLIPDNVFEKYAKLVEMMGERAAVLTLEDAADVRKMAEDIMDAVNIELSLVETLTDVFENYQDKVLDDDGKVMYSDTINKMVDAGKITTSDAEILRKYKSVVMPAEPATPMTEQQIADEKKQLEDFVMDSEIDETSLPSRDERDDARKLNELIKTAGVGSLTNTELKNLLKVIANINNGYFPHYAKIMIEKIDGANSNKEVTKFLETAKPLPISKIYARIKKLFVKGKDTIALMVERNPIQYIEQIFGDFKTDTLKKSLFDPIAKAFSNYENEYNKILNKIKDVENILSNHFKKEGNEITMSKYKMMTYMLQLENDSNPGSKEVAPAMDFLNKTINEIESGETNFTERDAEMLQEIATIYDDGSGNIDINKLYNSFSEAEKSAIKELQNINASLPDKAAYTANVIRGQKFTPLNNYIHHSVIAKSSPTDDATGASLVDQFNASRMPSTRAKSLTERTRGAKPISFDVLDSVSFAAKGQLMDYHLTSVIRTGRRTIDAAKKAARKMGKEKKEIMNAIGGAYERAIETVLVNSYVKSTFADDVVRIMSRQGYRAVLAGTSRFISELLSNVSFVMVKGRKYFVDGFKLKDVVMSADGATAMRNLNSKMTNRVYSSDTQSGNFIDRNIMKQAVGVSGSRAKSDIANKLNQIYSRTLKKPVNFVEATADTLISTPDKIVMRPAWFGAFSMKFQELTGSKPDFEKIASNDEAYMVDNKQALDEATGFADRETTFIGATDNPFMGILKGTATKDQSAFSKVFSTFNNYMSRFLIYEYATARTAVNAMVGNGQISKSEGAALMGAVATRMVMYSFLINMMGTGLIGMLLGDDDEEEENEKTVTQKLGQAVASGAVGLAIGRDFGNVTKNLVNYGIEKINKKYLDFLRNGEYDPYKDAIAFSIIGNEKEGQKSDVTKMLLNMTGPLAPTLKTAYFVAERLARPEPKGEEAKERRAKEMGIRLPLEILGNLGMVPLYKDVRKVVLNEIYKDMENANKDAKIKSDIKALLLQGYPSIESMRRYDPELYEQTYGDGGLEDMMLPADAIKKEINKEMKRLKLEMMDEVFDYTPKEKGKKNSFSREPFGGKPKKMKKFGE